MLAVREGLDLAHRRGVVHRDIKPSNIFLVDGSCRAAKLLDFGVARRRDARIGVTRTGLIVGTPEYMAPEQARGERNIGPAADIFSLGCVLFECLTGRSPFAGAHAPAVLVRILFETPPPLGDERLREALTRLQARQEAVSELYWMGILLPLVVYREDPEDAEWIAAEATRVLAQPQIMAAACGLSSCALASLDLAAGRVAEVAARMPEIHAYLMHVPPHRLLAYDRVIRLAIVGGSAAEARQRAEEALQTLAEIGDGGAVEVRVRLAAAEAFKASGDPERAAAELALAVRRIEARAEKIADPVVRAQFMAEVPENRRALALAATWASANG